MLLKNEAETKQFVMHFAMHLKFNSIVLLYGDLGSGKTFFCREVIKYFCGRDTTVISPTFNILQTYQAHRFMIYHFDFYRLKALEEIYEIGIEEAFKNNLCLIEWPQIIEHIIPKPLIKVDLQIISENQRYCNINHNNDK